MNLLKLDKIRFTSLWMWMYIVISLVGGDCHPLIEHIPDLRTDNRQKKDVEDQGNDARPEVEGDQEDSWNSLNSLIPEMFESFISGEWRSSGSTRILKLMLMSAIWSDVSNLCRTTRWGHWVD